MLSRPVRAPKNRQWRTLLTYNFYRLVSIGLFLIIYFYSVNTEPYPLLFFSILYLYFMCILLFFYVGHIRSPRFEQQVLISGTIDVIISAILLSMIGNMRSGQGILLNVTIAALSILAPGRLAIYFASLASCLLLCGNVWQFITTNSKDLGTFYYSGIYGAGFFATALTAWYLSIWVRTSEHLAQVRSEELAGMQKINEYIVGRLHSGIIYADKSQHITLINSAAKEFFNLDKKQTPHHLLQLSPLLSIKFDDFLSKRRPIEGGQTTIDEPYLKVHFFSTEIADNPAVLIMLEDMTNIAQQAQQLKLASLGRFSASIAHELRNPLGAIAHAVQLLGDEGKLHQEDARLKQLIIKNCDRMNGVIKNVLQLSRREQAQPELNELSSFLTQFNLSFCHYNPCNITIKLPKKKSYLVFDKSQLEQILVILCENAIQHGKDEHGEVHITISVKAQQYKIAITVADSGAGVLPELRDTIFEPFFTTLPSGTGMGLFIARELCEINQARLNLARTQTGTAFVITQNLMDEVLL